MLKIGDRVVVPSPTKGDAWTEGDFLARVASFRGDGHAVVVDQDDNAWEVECARLLECGEEGEVRGETAGCGGEEILGGFAIGDKVRYQGLEWRVVGLAGRGSDRMVALEPDSARFWVRECHVQRHGEK